MYFPCTLKYGYPDLSASASAVPRILLNWRGKEGEGEVGEVQVAEELMGDGDGEGDGDREGDEGRHRYMKEDGDIEINIGRCGPISVL